MGCIQIGHTYLLPCRLVESHGECDSWVLIFSHKLIYLLDINSPLSSSQNPSFVDCWLVFIAFSGSAFIDHKNFLRCVCKFSMGVFKSDIHILFPHRFVEGCGKGSGCVIALVIITWLNVFKSVIPRFSCWVLLSTF